MAQPSVVLRLVLLLLVLLTGLASSLFAQDGQDSANPRVRELQTALSRYYEEPFDVPRFLSEWERQFGSFFGVHMGFLAGLFAKHPEKIETVTAMKLGRQTQFTT